jgi:hypothetical protein
MMISANFSNVGIAGAAHNSAAESAPLVPIQTYLSIE